MTDEYRVYLPGQVIPDDRWYRNKDAAIGQARRTPGAIVERVQREVIWRNDY